MAPTKLQFTRPDRVVAFDLGEDGQIRVSRAEAEHEDPAIAAFLTLLARDMESGQHLRDLPPELARVTLEQAGHKVDLDEPIAGDVVPSMNTGKVTPWERHIDTGVE